MCVYCMIGDWMFKTNPPWHIPNNPMIPQPIVPLPIPTWPVDRLKEFEDLLRRVKELEDKVGCPCEPNKVDYLQLLKDKIESLESQVNKEETK